MQKGFAPLSGELGFYPVVPNSDWVKQLLDWGVRTIQLRYKSTTDEEAIAKQVCAAVAAGRAVPGAKIFINDHWRHALAEGAYGVHLGQEDWATLSRVDRELLRVSGMRLGLSTHTPEELALARAVMPSYLAIGPVYPTTLKAMPYEAVGLEKLSEWTHRVSPCAVVAIGGISLARLPEVVACGVDGVAVVSAVTQAIDPRQASITGMRAFTFRVGKP